VKVPKAITHQARLIDAESPVRRFADEVRELGNKLAVLLVQLPPKLAFDMETADRFFTTLHGTMDAEVVCEPRHSTWFDDDADELLRRLRVARVAADPAICPAASSPGGWRGLHYWRLHGSPNVYRSSYGAGAIADYAAQIRAALSDGVQPWCVFDNTAASEATGNALSLIAAVGSKDAVSGKSRRCDTASGSRLASTRPCGET
jgi:uncharacterized protein YecE (DUF72 family)